VNPTDRRYTREHEWVKLDGALAVVGITDYAQDQLGDVVFVELPSVGSSITQHETFGVIESVKTASDLFSPVSGEVVEVNQEVVEEPQRVNESPYEAGWLIKVQPADVKELDSLLTAEQYEQHVGEA
jgi:glycine cleavage system H protein